MNNLTKQIIAVSALILAVSPLGYNYYLQNKAPLNIADEDMLQSFAKELLAVRGCAKEGFVSMKISDQLEKDVLRMSASTDSCQSCMTLNKEYYEERVKEIYTNIDKLAQQNVSFLNKDKEFCDVEFGRLQQRVQNVRDANSLWSKIGVN